MAAIRHWVVPIFILSLYLCQIIFGSLWNFKHKLLRYKPIIQSCLIQVAYPNSHYRTWDSPNFHAIPLSFPNQLGSLWNVKLKLLGYHFIILSCLIQAIYANCHYKTWGPPSFLVISSTLPNHLESLWNFKHKLMLSITQGGLPQMAKQNTWGSL